MRFGSRPRRPEEALGGLGDGLRGRIESAELVVVGPGLKMNEMENT